MPIHAQRYEQLNPLAYFLDPSRRMFGGRCP
jgi:hypothetical protein